MTHLTLGANSLRWMRQTSQWRGRPSWTGKVGKMITKQHLHRDPVKNFAVQNDLPVPPVITDEQMKDMKFNKDQVYFLRTIEITWEMFFSFLSWILPTLEWSLGNPGTIFFISFSFPNYSCVFYQKLCVVCFDISLFLMMTKLFIQMLIQILLILRHCCTNTSHSSYKVDSQEIGFFMNWEFPTSQDLFN